MHRQSIPHKDQKDNSRIFNNVQIRISVAICRKLLQFSYILLHKNKFWNFPSEGWISYLKTLKLKSQYLLDDKQVNQYQNLSKSGIIRRVFGGNANANIPKNTRIALQVISRDEHFQAHTGYESSSRSVAPHGSHLHEHSSKTTNDGKWKKHFIFQRRRMRGNRSSDKSDRRDAARRRRLTALIYVTFCNS